MERNFTLAEKVPDSRSSRRGLPKLSEETGSNVNGLNRGQAKADPRRRYYRLTPFGSAVARAETRRLTQLVRLARHVWRVAPESS